MVQLNQPTQTKEGPGKVQKRPLVWSVANTNRHYQQFHTGINKSRNVHWSGQSQIPHRALEAGSRADQPAVCTLGAMCPAEPRDKLTFLLIELTTRNVYVRTHPAIKASGVPISPASCWCLSTSPNPSVTGQTTPHPHPRFPRTRV